VIKNDEIFRPFSWHHVRCMLA